VKQKLRIKLLVVDVAKQRGLDRAKLARKADLTYETVWKLWTDPHRDVSLTTLVKLARALDVDVQELFVVVDE
jgi:DNA-binding Xre family transcriptional regulator